MQRFRSSRPIVWSCVLLILLGCILFIAGCIHPAKTIPGQDTTIPADGTVNASTAPALDATPAKNVLGLVARPVRTLYNPSVFTTPATLSGKGGAEVNITEVTLGYETLAGV